MERSFASVPKMLPFDDFPARFTMCYSVMSSLAEPRRHRVLLILLIFFSVAVVVFPVFIMRPFVQQQPALLMMALAVARWSFWLALVAALAGLMLTFRFWARRPERMVIVKNTALIAAVAILCGAVLASRINI